MINLICDALIFLIVALSVWLGWKRGFIKTVLGFLAVFLAFAFALLLVSPVAAFCSEKAVEPALTSVLESSLKEACPEEGAPLLPEKAKEVLERYGLPAEEAEALLAEKMQEQGERAAHGVAEIAAAKISLPLTRGVVFLVLFCIGLVLIYLLIKVLDLVSRLPGLNASNRLLGALCGVLRGAALAVLLAVLLALAENTLRGSESAFLSAFAVEKTVLVRPLAALVL